MIRLLSALSLSTLLVSSLGKPGLVKRTPSNARPRCTPSFDGQAVSILSSSTSTPVQVGNINSFSIQQDGQDPSAFLIKNAADANQAVTAIGLNLALEPVTVNGNGSWQKFTISCSECGTPGTSAASRECRLESHSTLPQSATKPCLDESGILERCNEWDNTQSFSIVKTSDSGKASEHHWEQETSDSGSSSSNSNHDTSQADGDISQNDHNQSQTEGAPPAGAMCHPNFEFEGVRVSNSGINWGANAFEDDQNLFGIQEFQNRMEVRFEQVGSPEPVYVGKVLNGTNLAVAVRENGNLYLTNQLDSNNDRHKWKIECQAFCRGAGQVLPGDLASDGCTIKSSSNDKCVQLGGGPRAGSTGDPIFLEPCDGSDSQRWNFPTSPFKTSGRKADNEDEWRDHQVAAAIGTGDPESTVDGDVKKLITNSYIIIGMLAAVLVAVIVLGVVLSRGGLKLKGKESARPRYNVVVTETDPESESFTVNSKEPYSD